MGVEILIAAIVGTIAAVIGAVQGAKNTAAQENNLAYQQRMQQEVFAREDNAVLRRAKDLEAAGLSKTLAAGSAAQTSAPIKTEAPQMELGLAQSLGNLTPSIMGVAKQGVDYSQTKAQTELTKEMTMNKALERNLINAQTNQANAQAYKSFTDAGVSKWDLEQAMKGSVSTKPTPLGGFVRDVRSMGEGALDSFINYGKFQQNRATDYYQKGENALKNIKAKYDQVAPSLWGNPLQNQLFK